MHRRQHDVFERSEMLEQRVALEDDPDAPPQRAELRLGRHGAGLQRYAADLDSAR